MKSYTLDKKLFRRFLNCSRRSRANSCNIYFFYRRKFNNPSVFSVNSALVVSLLKFAANLHYVLI